MDSSDNRSWVEICEEEFSQKPNNHCNLSVNESLEEGEIRDHSAIEIEVSQKTEILSKTDDDNVRSSTYVKMKPKTPEKCDTKLVENFQLANSLSYAKVLSQGMKNEMPSSTCNVKRVSNIATDDLSLTSHLDIFHVESPRKDLPVKTEADIEILLDEDTVMFSPCKSSNENIVTKNTKRPFMLIDSPVQEPRERTSSVHSTHKIAKSEINSDVHTSTNENNANSPSSKRELEVNPDILSRRQKQIDYGKNTLGYERYLKIVPKHKRTKEQPKTPPKHLKMSRRTWDGLIKNWRMKLHKWDPASENEDFDLDSANFDQFSLSSEDPSSYDSSSLRSDSTVSTPKQGSSIVEGDDGGDLWNKEIEKSENSKELWSKCPEKTDKSDEDEYLGCEPLTENCVKACS